MEIAQSAPFVEDRCKLVFLSRRLGTADPVRDYSSVTILTPETSHWNFFFCNFQTTGDIPFRVFPCFVFNEGTWGPGKKWSGMGSWTLDTGGMNWRGTKEQRVITSEWNWNFRSAALLRHFSVWHSTTTSTVTQTSGFITYNLAPLGYYETYGVSR